MDNNELILVMLCLFEIRQYQNDDNAALVKQLQAELRTSRMENTRLRNRFQERYDPILSEFSNPNIISLLTNRNDFWKATSGFAGFPTG